MEKEKEGKSIVLSVCTRFCELDLCGIEARLRLH